MTKQPSGSDGLHFSSEVLPGALSQENRFHNALQLLAAELAICRAQIGIEPNGPLDMDYDLEPRDGVSMAIQLSCATSTSIRLRTTGPLGITEYDADINTGDLAVQAYDVDGQPRGELRVFGPNAEGEDTALLLRDMIFELNN
jgi:hypothetical protein